jgi:hypothetical protein
MTGGEGELRNCICWVLCVGTLNLIIIIPVVQRGSKRFPALLP